MANALGQLFGDIAAAIREKTGETGTMKPAQFPEKIAAMETGADTGEIDDFLDEINGEVIGEAVYVVTFLGTDGTLLWKASVSAGDDCPDPVAAGSIEAPVKESTKYICYVHSGWSAVNGGAADDGILSGVTGDITVYAAFAEEENYIARGTHRAVTWVIDPDYILRFTGTGEIGNRLSADSYTTPWLDHKDRIAAAVIGEGVTGIYQYVFQGCTALTDVTLPQSLKDIGYHTFDGCTALNNITLPQNLGAIQTYGFKGCSALTGINIPSSVTWIGASAFSGCGGLVSAVFDKPTGWKYENWDTGTRIPDEGVANPATAAAYLTGTYTGNWYNYT